MGGPGAGVWLPGPLDEAQQAELSHMIDSVASERRGDDFWVVSTLPIGGRYQGEGKPFLVCLEDDIFWGCVGDDPSSLEAETREVMALVEPCFDRSYSHDITCVAMCNGREDHRILGELCLWTAEQFDGIVDFNGLLIPRTLTDEEDEIGWHGVREKLEAWMSQFPGKILAIPYKGCAGTVCAYHVADAVFLRAWLEHPEFHMIK